ncbi:hypothetical protein ACIBEJ_45930 [Nonomuraea sp. NPDC050790]|uniref:hypothetical protein n=1 Tax=Nonomuraea sp. NPDC050790 TaxID=3364371 RepID=UPI0037A24854
MADEDTLVDLTNLSLSELAELDGVLLESTVSRLVGGCGSTDRLWQDEQSVPPSGA